ncbi:MAG: molybdopterin converting factor subunit 1 [Tepidisphaeraceae bacterium]
MRINVKLFAALRDRAGTSEIVLELPIGASASAGMEAVVARHPAMRDLASRVAVAINREYAGRDTILHDGDELALIPPVSGG